MTILRYELNGLSGVIINGEAGYVDIDNPYISQIRLEDDFKILEVVLKENILYFDNQEQIDNAVYGIFFNILLEIQGYIECPEIVRTKIIGENDKLVDNKTYIKNSPVDARISLHADAVYESIVRDNFVKNAEVELQLVLAMLQNKNEIVTFLSLYDYIKEKIWRLYYSSEKRSTQEQVTTYLRNHQADYGEDLMFVVDNHGKTVDWLTYLRNEISHATIKNNVEEYKNLGKNINSGIIRLALKIINNLLMEQYGNG